MSVRMEVLRCPHCGGFAKEKEDVWGYHMVQCQVCGCRTRGTQTKQECIDLWNARKEKKR